MLRRLSVVDDITSRPFREAHLDVFKVTDSHKAECHAAAKIMGQLGHLHQFGSHFLDGRILYISGFLWIAPGVIEVYMHPSVYVPQYRRVFLEHVKWWLSYIAHDTGARRMQTWGDCSPRSDRWLSWLGFTKEAVLNSYRPDGDMAIWGIVTCKR